MVAEQIAKLIATLTVKTNRDALLWDLLSNTPEQLNNAIVQSFITEEELTPQNTFCLPHHTGCVLLAKKSEDDFIFAIQQKQYMPISNYYYGGMHDLLTSLYDEVSKNIDRQYEQPDGLYTFINSLSNGIDDDEL